MFTQPHLVRLTFPKNTKSVTLNITAIPDVPTRRYIEDAAPKLFAGKVSVKAKTNNSVVLEVDPVDDPKTVEPAINFGKVTSMKGRTFEIEAKKIDLPPPTDAEVTAALEDLKSTDRPKRAAGADQLAKAYVPLPAQRAEVSKALEGQVTDKDIWAANAALRALQLWGGPECVPAVLRAVEHNFTRGEALNVLANYKDPAAAVAIANMLPSPGGRVFAVNALKAMGPVAEKAVIPFVTGKNGFAAREACNILKEIGTTECIPILTEAANSNNAFINGYARDTLKVVQARLKAAKS